MPDPANPKTFSAENFLKFGAIIVALVTALGYPAVLVQFARRGIPIAFLDKELAIRAGLMPTLLLLVIVGLLWWLIPVLPKDAEMGAWVREGAVAKVYAGIMVGVVIVGPLFDAVTMYDLSLAVAIRRPGSELVKASRVVGVGAISIVILALMASLFAEPFLAYFRRGRKGPLAKPGVAARIQKSVFSFYKGPWKWLHGMQPFTLSIVSWLMLAATSSVAAWVRFSVKGSLPLSHLAYTLRFAQQGSYYYLYCLAGASFFPFLFALVAQAHLPDPLAPEEARRRQWRLRIASVCFAYIPLVVANSLAWWPNIPAQLGGGKPSAVTLWVKAGDLPKSVISKLTMLRVAPDESSSQPESGAAKTGEKGTVDNEASVRLEHCFLVDVNSEVIIISDEDGFFAATIVLPRDSVKALASSR